MADVAPEYRAQGEFYFLKLMAEEIENGEYPPGSTFTQESISYVFRMFRVPFGPIYSDRYLNSKLKLLKKKYRDFSELMSYEGVYWDKNTNIVYGNDQLLRERYKARYRRGVCIGEQNYDLMCQVFETGITFEQKKLTRRG